MNLVEKLTGRTSYNQYYSRLRLTLERPVAKISGLASLTVFTVVFFLFFAILPTFKTIASLKKEISDAKNVEAKLSQKIYSLNQAETLMVQVAPNLEALNLVLPDQPDWQRLAWQIYWLAQKDGLTVAGGSFDEFEPTFIPVSLAVTGSYPALKTYLADLNQLDRLIEVEEISISNQKTGLSGGNLTANLKLKAFYQPGL